MMGDYLFWDFLNYSYLREMNKNILKHCRKMRVYYLYREMAQNRMKDALGTIKHGRKQIKKILREIGVSSINKHGEVI